MSKVENGWKKKKKIGTEELEISDHAEGHRFGCHCYQVLIRTNLESYVSVITNRSNPDQGGEIISSWEKKSVHVTDFYPI